MKAAPARIEMPLLPRHDGHGVAAIFGDKIRGGIEYIVLTL